ncbi:MAG: COX15/CtaA family protein [Anaerolineae bacterium]|nr:COX15/CtaA family protein [Anaerolineae bacterium]MDW8173136.1 COX15/CtaA family protein [Anaerolineae bacterium]
MQAAVRNGGASKPHAVFLWSLATAFLTAGLIVFGAVVRVTDSGLGCGNEWPLCNGTIIPPLDNLTAWIEWLHRLFAVLIGLCGLMTLRVAWRAYRKQDTVILNAVLVSAGLFLLQSALGALVVVLDLPPTFVTLHLGTAMLLLGGLLMAAVMTRYRPRQRSRVSNTTTLIYANTFLSLVIILTGALVRGSGATLACVEWPTCINGSVLPLEYGQLAVIHMIHRLAVAVMGLTLVLLTWQVWRTRDRLTFQISLAATVTYFAQAGVGAFYVLSVGAPFWGAAHVGMAAATWALLVVLSAVEALNTGQIQLNTSETWNPQSEALPQS